MRDWTSEQQDAINARNSNILVSAGAGSGKTAILVERVTKKIIEGTSIDNMLIVTFTNAAAAEMKSRIASSLSNLLNELPNNDYIAEQISLMPNAQICTIDSFCSKLVKENFESLEIERDFKLLDSSDESILNEEALSCVLEKYYDEGSSAFHRLVELFSSSKNSTNFNQVIKTIYTNIKAQPDPLGWLEKVCEFYNPDIEFKDSVWYELIFYNIQSNVDYVFKKLNEVKLNLDICDELYDKIEDYISSYINLFELISENLQNLENISLSLMNYSFKRFPSKKGYISPNKEKVKQICEFAKKEVFDKIVLKYFEITDEDHKKDMEYLYPCFKELFKIVKDYDKKLLELKKEKNSYTFSDIEQFALSLVVKNNNGMFEQTEIAKELSEKYDEIMVDEYQDTNKAQDLLFSSISNNRNLFTVGDVKQSIYKFRLAMPEIFIERKNSYLPYDKDMQNSSVKIYLNKNFRSHQNICKYCNFVFSKIFSQEVGGLDYDENEYLNAGAKYPENDFDNIYIRMVKSNSDVGSDAEVEAQAISDFIKSKIKEKLLVRDFDENGNEIQRPVELKDFAVLFRKGKKNIQTYAEVMENNGISVNCENANSLFENKEIIILVSLLKAINNPMNDIALLSTLMSSLFGFTAEEIAELKISSKNKKLFLVLNEQRKENQKVNDFLSFIEKYRNMSVAMSCSQFVLKLVNDISFVSVISSSGIFDDCRLNIMKFIELAKNYDNSDNRGLTAFVRYLDKIIKDNSVKSSVVQNIKNSVSLMTIHKSKGLEFPFVIVAGTSNRYSNRNTDNILIHSAYGLASETMDEENYCKYKTRPFNAISERLKQEEMSENIRVLYVALTRAKQYLAVFMTLKKPEETLNKLLYKASKDKIDPVICRTASSDAQLILMTSLFHKSSNKYVDDISAVLPSADSDFALNMEIVDVSNLEEDDLQEEEKCLPNNELISKMNERFKFSYDSQLSKIASQRNASELDDLDMGYRYFCSAVPSFIDKENVTSAEKGTAMHSFMQFCDYEKASVSVEKEISRLFDEGFLTKQYCNIIDVELIENFFKSNLAKRILNADKVYREFKLTSFVPVSFAENIDSNEKILVQGIADCIFEENGELVLVDFKSDKMKDETTLRKTYKKQLDFYKIAVEKTLKKKVKQACLYSFVLSKECYF